MIMEQCTISLFLTSLFDADVDDDEYGGISDRMK